MEIREHDLRAMVREVDDEHHESLDTVRDGAASQAADALATNGITRRDFARRLGLVSVTIGAAAVPLAAFAPAAAQEADEAALTVDQLLLFARAVELAAVEAYAALASSGKVTTSAVLAAAATFAGHHRDHAAAFGRGSSGRPSATLLQQVNDQIAAAADETGVLGIAYTVENAAASTYQFALAEIARFDSSTRGAGVTTTSTPAGVPSARDAQELFASVLPIEAGHAVVLGTLLGRHLDQDTVKAMIPPFETQTAALDPRELAPELLPASTSTTTA